MGEPILTQGDEEQLASIYYGSSEGAFRGPIALYRAAQSAGLAHISLADCKRFLQGQPTYTLYRPARRNYPRNHIRAYYCGEVFQIDIIDLSRFASENAGMRYALLGYDTYSKYAISHALANRTPTSVLQGLEHIILSVPFAIVRIYWDKEGSFLSKRVQNWLTSQNIRNYTTTAKVKAPGVERLIRTVRTYLQRYFEATGTWRWLERLPAFLSLYNNRIHSTTRRRPLDLVNDPMLAPLQRQRPTGTSPALPPIDSYVRLNRLRGIFEKEASGGWTRELFKVTGHQTGQAIPMIRVQDLLGGPVKGSLYPHEYQAIQWDGDRTVQSVLAHRTKDGRKQRLVTFVEYPQTYSEWIYSV
jgi:hypothetical protein